MTGIFLRTAVMIAVSLVALAAQAQDASPWTADSHSAIRLLAGSRGGPVMLGGLSIQLDPGWKTYWRTPGDSGVPPRFDFSASDNVEAVTVLWPAPAKFPDGAGGYSFGYAKQVTLPLRIVAKSPDKPLVLRATVNYAVCEKLCLPVEAHAELTFSSSASTEDRNLSAALDTVPKPATIGDNNPVTVRDVKRTAARTLLIDAVVPEHSHADLFVEGPTADWALAPPERLKESSSGAIRFALDLDGAPQGAQLEGAALKLTLVTSEGSYEFNTNIGPTP